MKPTVDKWDARYLALSLFVSSFSKDPSTQVGCVIARRDRTIASIGFNGFARDVEDTSERLHDRALKYPLTIHAELNAVLNAKEPINGYVAFVTHPPCAACASVLIQAGIAEIVAIMPTPDMLSRWGDSFNLTQDILNEAGVGLTLVDKDQVTDHFHDNIGGLFEPDYGPVNPSYREYREACC